MNFDYKLTKEIYGNPWFIDPVSFLHLSKILESQQINIDFKENEKSNNFNILSKTNAYNAFRVSRMEEVPKDSIAIYYFDSVITKHGGLSHYGTKEIAAQFSKMEANENIIGHMFHIESGGGSATAVKYIRDVSAKTIRKKPLVVYAEDLMASAAMYIGSDADYIYVKSGDALIGSIGTMVALEGYKEGTEDKKGKRHIRIYGTKSFNKNKEYEEAINNYNYEPIKKNILDPHSEVFIKDMEQNRPNITEDQKTGAIFKASEVVGTLIDEIGSYDNAIEKITELHKLNNNLKSTEMNLTELKAEHPTVYAEIFESGKKAGIDAEKNRIESWLVFKDLDNEKVQTGIEGGLEMKESEKLSFLRLSQNAKLQEDLEDESADNIAPDLVTGKITPKSKTEDKAVDAAFDELLGEKKEEK